MNNFKNSLKTLPNSQKNNVSFIENLNLNDFPKNIIIKLSDDQSCINVCNTNFEKPLTFNIPIHEETFSALYNNPRCEDLLNRYKLYSTEYKKIITNYSIAERKFLQERFPNLVFNIKIRQKSEYSYKKKLNDKLKVDPNADVTLHDIMAERIIITQLDKNVPIPTDKEEFEEYEKKLQETCLEVSEELNKFRINSGFTLIKEKNYIENPKDNGYQSIHDIMQNNLIPDCLFETQIRTLYMEKMSKTSGEIAHTTYKPRLLNENSISKLPTYTEITPFLDANGNPIAIEIPFDDTFYHFYGVQLSKHREQLNTVLPFIENIKNKIYNFFRPQQEYNEFLVY